MTLRPEMTPVDGAPSSGSPTRPRPKDEGKLTDIVPLVVFTAFGIEEARELAQRLRNTIHPVDRPPHSTPAKDPPSATHTSSSKSESKKRQAQQETKPARPDPQPEHISEPEATLPDLGDIRSSDYIFLNMDAVDLSHYMSTQHDDLVREVSISLRHEKFILSYLEDPLAYLKHFATYTWDEESDAAAEKFIQWYVERFRPELERQRELEWMGDDIQSLAKDAANNERELVIAYDLEAGEVLFVRYGDRDSVTMQTLHQKLAEGREIFLIHNHPNNSGASPADLSAAAWLDAEYMIIVNPDGTVHRHQKIDGEIVELEPIHNPDFVAPFDPVETAVDSIAYWIQTLREIGNPAEMVMRQGERDPRIHKESFQFAAAPIKRNFVRYSEPTAPEDFWQRHFHTIGRNLLRDSYGRKAEGVSRAAEISGFSGYDDASHYLRHFLGGSGDPIDDLPVDRMIQELPLFREDIIQNIRDSLVDKFASGELEPIDVSEDSTTYAFPTDWRFVGSEGKAEADIYGFTEKPLDSGYGDTFDMLTANPPEEVERAVYDWNLALGKFYYSVRVNVTVNNVTQDAQLAMQVEVQDRYAWYKNEEVGEVNHQMADLEIAGHGRNFAISGESSVIEDSFNLNNLGTGREEPLSDWPEDG